MLKLEQESLASFRQHIEFGDRPSTTGHEFKPPCRQTSFNTTLNLYQLQGCSPVTDPALRPCCEKRISLQGSIKCHISTIMHSREVKHERNYLYKSLRHINHARDLRACQTHDCSPLHSAVKCHAWTLPAVRAGTAALCSNHCRVNLHGRWTKRPTLHRSNVTCNSAFWAVTDEDAHEFKHAFNIFSLL